MFQSNIRSFDVTLVVVINRYVKKTCLIHTCERNEKQSQYKGVSWHKASRKWRVQFQLKGQKQKHIRLFTEELDAAKRVNQICGEWGIPPKNPGISGMPNQVAFFFPGGGGQNLREMVKT